MNNKIPNCGLCKWILIDESIVDILGNKSKDYRCSAIAFNDVRDVYGSDKCKNVYEERIDNETM